VLVNYIREYNVTHGIAAAQAYNATMYVMAGLLVIGLILQRLCKISARAVSYTSRRGGRRGRSGSGVRERVMESTRQPSGTGNGIKLVLAWGIVGIPLVWGIIQTLVNIIKAFQ
jgi:hypothetical protein